MSSNENLAPMVVTRIMKEVKGLMSEPAEDIRVVVNDDDLSEIRAIISGPEGTPYEGGEFEMKLTFGNDFPAAPPKGYFLTKIFHPNISKTGEICVNTLKKDWKPELGIKHILLTIKCLLIFPNAESALNEEAGKLLLEHYDEFAARAKMMTEVHAPKKSVAGEDDEDDDDDEDDEGSSKKLRVDKKAADKKKQDKKKGLKRL